MFKKSHQEITLKEHTEKLFSFDLRMNLLQESINEQAKLINKLLDCVKLLDRKLKMLEGYFQLEYKGNSYISTRKK